MRFVLDSMRDKELIILDTYTYFFDTLVGMYNK